MRDICKICKKRWPTLCNSFFPKLNLRYKLHKLYPEVLGFGVVFDSTKVKDGYQFHLARCPKPKGYQDCLYWAMISSLDGLKGKKKRKATTVLGNHVRVGSRDATQVRYRLNHQCCSTLMVHM
jgi:hypothetical protein